MSVSSSAPPPHSKNSDGRPSVALVLSGGGARGAYEIGVLRFIRENLKIDTHFDIITGTSVGAINGAYIAATCDRPRAQGRMLQRVWSELSIDNVYKFGWNQLRELPKVLFGKTPTRIAHGGKIGGIVDGRHLEKLVQTKIPWRGISDNIRSGHLKAFACTATEIATGLSTVFVHTPDHKLPAYWPHVPHEAVVSTQITAAHTLASAAIPVLFPAVRVGERLFVDGSLRQNTPLRPAMRLGADRLLVIGLRNEKSDEHHALLRAEAQSLYPNAVFLLGKMLNALMLDKVEADLERISRTNELVRSGEAAFGPEFTQRLADHMGRLKPYKAVETLLVQPSEDLGELAWEEIQRNELKQYSGIAARWIRRTLTSDENQESDLASYIMFDPAYVQTCIDLGFEDARRHKDDLLALFDR